MDNNEPHNSNEPHTEPDSETHGEPHAGKTPESRPDTQAPPVTPPSPSVDPSLTVRLDRLPPIPGAAEPVAPHSVTAPMPAEVVRDVLQEARTSGGAPEPTDHWSTRRPVGIGGGIPPVGGVGAPSWASGEPTPEPAPVRRKGRILPLLGVLVGLAVIAGGAVFAFGALSGDEKANTPQEAIQGLLDAVAREDAIGVMEAMVPGERDVLLDSLVPMVEEFKRLAILDPELDLNKIPGVDARFSKLRYKTQEMRPDLAVVTVTGGTAFGRVDPKRLPLGDFVRDLVGDELTESEPQESSTDIADNDDEGDEEIKLAVVKDGNRWYFSAGYTIAEAARGDNFDFPGRGEGVAANGADSPEAAVGDMIRALASLDVRRVVELLPPDEMAALHDYAGVFIDDAVSGVEDARSQYRLTFPVLEFTTQKTGRTTLVKIRDITANLRFQADDGTNIVARYADRCIRVTVDDETKRRCGSDVLKLVEDFGGPPVSIPEDQTAAARRGQRTPQLGIVAIQRDGKWYVSPTRSGLDFMTAVLKLVTSKDLDDIRDQIQGMMDDGSDGVDSDFEVGDDSTSGSSDDSSETEDTAVDSDTVPDFTIPES